MWIDQLLFGYEDGHRQLVGSTQLDRDASSLLLGATDATVASPRDALVTGLPLASEKIFALSMTWLAPEIERPGAVWAHTLLINFEDLSRVRQPSSLLMHLRRPKGFNLDSYSHRLAIDPAARLPLRNDLRLTQNLLDVSTERNAGVVIHSDLEAATATLLVLWSAQWPALRTAFSFRTRESARLQDSPYVAVARRTRGMHRTATPSPGNHERKDREWLKRLTDDPTKPRSLPRFLLVFGPEEKPNLKSLVLLGELHDLVSNQNPRAVIAFLERTHPAVREGRLLKTALFGTAAATWWPVSELDLVGLILATKRPIFDPLTLDLVPRLRGLIDQGRLRELIAYRSQSAPKAIQSSLLEALAREASIDSYLIVAQTDERLAHDLLMVRRDLLTHPESWRAISPAEAEELVSQIPLTGEMTVAAVRGGQFRALLKIMSLPRLAECLIETGQLKLMRQTARALGRELKGIDKESRSEAALLLAAAGAPPADLTDLLAALEDLRTSVDEKWLRAAVVALGSAKGDEMKRVLKVIFGPVHHAITDDRLPRDLWKGLDKKLPKGDDASLRLRRLLVRNVRAQSWSFMDLKMALRDSGPYITQLGQELEEDDDLIRRVLTAST